MGVQTQAARLVVPVSLPGVWPRRVPVVRGVLRVVHLLVAGAALAAGGAQPGEGHNVAARAGRLAAVRRPLILLAPSVSHAVARMLLLLLLV